MVRAMRYAIRFAAERRMPLVMNLSFGVGNEQEGKARIDRLVGLGAGGAPRRVAHDKRAATMAPG